MKTSELRNLTKDELSQRYNSLKEELFNLRFEAETGKIEKPHRIRQVKKDIAKIKTILREEQNAAR